MYCPNFCLIISTHAPAGGATLPTGKLEDFDIFLLTPLREGRLDCIGHQAHIVKISTHAPAGGATELLANALSVPADFYSRPCGRGDGKMTIKENNLNIFLLTPLREGRQNSPLVENGPSSISTHAPAGGATLGCCGSLFVL